MSIISLHSPLFNLQFTFLTDSNGSTFIRYREDLGLKTNKGGLKHRKIYPKVVDIYPIQDKCRCPVHNILIYIFLLPANRKNTVFYLQPHHKFSPGKWYHDKAVRSNKLRDVIKEITKKAGIQGFSSNHSLCSTCATTSYQSNVDEPLIQEITGHCSLAVRSYKRTCDSQRRMASNCIF